MNLHALSDIILKNTAIYLKPDELKKLDFSPNKNSFINYLIILRKCIKQIDNSLKYSVYQKIKASQGIEEVIGVLGDVNYDYYKIYNNRNLIPVIKNQAKLLKIDETIYLQKISSSLLDQVIIPDFDKIEEIIRRIDSLQKYAKHNKIKFTLNKKLLKLITKQYASSLKSM